MALHIAWLAVSLQPQHAPYLPLSLISGYQPRNEGDDQEGVLGLGLVRQIPACSTHPYKRYISKLILRARRVLFHDLAHSDNVECLVMLLLGYTSSDSK